MLNSLRTFSKVDLSTGSRVSGGHRRVPVPVWLTTVGPNAWLDPENNVPGCPEKYHGFGWWPEFRDTAELADGERHGTPFWSEPDTENMRVVQTVPAVTKNEGELLAETAAIAGAKRAEIRSTFVAKIAAGYSPSAGVQVGLNDAAFVTLAHAQQALAEGADPFTARTSLGTPITLSSAEQVASLIAAMRLVYLGYAKREAELYAEVDDAMTESTSADQRIALAEIEVGTGW